MNKYLYTIVLVCFASFSIAQTPLGTEFTYQGELKDTNGDAHNGEFDFKFEAFDAEDDGMGANLGTFTVENVDVSEGIFTTQLDFGSSAFTGDKVWLEISVREGASLGSYQQLLPRQSITAIPYATHAEFVAADAISSLEIQDGTVGVDDINDNEVQVRITGSCPTGFVMNGVENDGSVFCVADVGLTTVTSADIQDGTIQAVDLANASVSIDKLAANSVDSGKIVNDSITENDIDSDAVGEDEIITSEVQTRVSGTCSAGQYITSITENGTVLCEFINKGDANSTCKTLQGDFGVVINDICVLDYNSQTVSTWDTAVNSCNTLGGDLCTASQYYRLGNGDIDDQLAYNNRSLWTNDFSDNDAGVKDFVIHSSDDPSVLQSYAYACCGGILPEPYNSQAEVINGVKVTFKHASEDTTWRYATKICTSKGSDLCTKSQYVAINDSGYFDINVGRATPDLSDNDGDLFDSILGNNTQDNPSGNTRFAFACCGTSKPLDFTCPGNIVDGVCVTTIHDTEDTNFLDAARACHLQGADICSKSEMTTIRNAGQFFSACWTNAGADNDSSRSGGLLNSQSNNPNPATTQYGYACCL